MIHYYTMHNIELQDEQVPFANFLIGKEQTYKKDKEPFANFLIGKEQTYKKDKKPFANFLKETRK